MKATNQQKYLYIVISQTGTLLSRILRLVTGAEYNHASISVSKDLNQMYSFGRRHPYNPFWGGFVMETPDTGTFKRFSNTKALVLAVETTDEQYKKICDFLSYMYSHKDDYHYNYIGLCLAAFHIKCRKNNCYYCSEFVGDILSKYQVTGVNSLGSIIQPINFLDLPHEKLFCGRLSEYNSCEA